MVKKTTKGNLVSHADSQLKRGNCSTIHLTEGKQLYSAGYSGQPHPRTNGDKKVGAHGTEKSMVGNRIIKRN